ncbi:NTP transferase domain-containing protein [Rhodococcoides fascians]|uniref:NTP transferase domain-containing protein n=1 Tax=Rhodococcoides fascians TaxID=1828 RepID=UPI00055FE3BA|nr:NTP transferase domain-containing protein [Rhodococcus fascians]
MSITGVDAVILAGGAARRMHGVDKPGLTVGRISMLQRMIDAAAVADTIVVVGPHRPELAPHIVQTRENPAGSGPVAAIAAGLDALRDRSVGTGDANALLILAADLPFVDAAAIDRLVAESDAAAATFAADGDGRTQYLFGVWNTAALRRSIDDLPDTRDLPMRALIPQDHRVIRIDGVDDCDTPEHLSLARRHLAEYLPAQPVPTVDEARETIRNRLRPIPTRRTATRDALGATSSEPVIASAPLPPVDISAMDGYAVCGTGPWTIRSEIAFAGTSGHRPLGRGEAMRIATGALVPAGADSVVRDEDVRVSGDDLNRAEGAPVRDDTRRAGEDWIAGTVLAPAGTDIGAALVSVALGAEIEDISVRGPVRARIILSGNEIRGPGELQPGQTRDTIGPVLPNYLAACGISTTDSEHLDDSPTAFDDLLADPTDADLVVVVGATGGGAADSLRSALVDADADVVVHRTRVRPGGSQITAVLPDGTVVLGLPGNPFAAVATVMVTGPAVVDALTARTPRPPLLGYVSGTDKASTTRIVPVVRDGTGWRVSPGIGTAHLRTLIDSDAVALIPPEHDPDVPVELVLLPR